VWDYIPAEPIQAGGNALCSEINELINSIWNKERTPFAVSSYKKSDKTIISVTNYVQNFMQYFPFKVNSMHRRNDWES
jgi:hypothetical protein